MNKKILASFLIISAFLMWLFIINNSQLEYLLIDNDRKSTNIKTPTIKTGDSITENGCAKTGEEPVSNFDLTTGKTDPNIKVLHCCEGLKEIQKKQRTNFPVTESGERVCASIVGVHNSICSPCGNGVCDSEYEDYCNCPEDCD
jgi:hypothetical protein